MADHAGDVDARAEPLDGVKVAAVVHPVPGKALENRRPRDVLDGLHHPGEQFPILRPAWRERDPAVADERRGDAVAGNRRDVRIPTDLRVQVGVHVDEARRDGHTLGVEFLPAGTVHLADDGDGPIVNRKVAGSRVAAKTVHQMPTANNEVVSHVELP